MDQYTEIIAGSPLEITNTINTFRYAVVGGVLYLQQDISGVWKDIQSYTAGGNGVFRVGVRTGTWNIDEALDAIGFSGTENTNWKAISPHKL